MSSTAGRGLELELEVAVKLFERLLLLEEEGALGFWPCITMGKASRKDKVSTTSPSPCISNVVSLSLSLSTSPSFSVHIRALTNSRGSF